MEAHLQKCQKNLDNVDNGDQSNLANFQDSRNDYRELADNTIKSQLLPDINTNNNQQQIQNQNFSQQNRVQYQPNDQSLNVIQPIYIPMPYPVIQYQAVPSYVQMPPDYIRNAQNQNSNINQRQDINNQEIIQFHSSQEYNKQKYQQTNEQDLTQQYKKYYNSEAYKDQYVKTIEEHRLKSKSKDIYNDEYLRQDIRINIDQTLNTNLNSISLTVNDQQPAIKFKSDLQNDLQQIKVELDSNRLNESIKNLQLAKQMDMIREKQVKSEMKRMHNDINYQNSLNNNSTSIFISHKHLNKPFGYQNSDSNDEDNDLQKIEMYEKYRSERQKMLMDQLKSFSKFTQSKTSKHVSNRDFEKSHGQLIYTYGAHELGKKKQSYLPIYGASSDPLILEIEERNKKRLKFMKNLESGSRNIMIGDTYDGEYEF
ncbi:UNKNOWN [Stylonychia lemnae]|uniref:Uncharacterized protein n=1 Tax=Stylonychia lemnae TaxID=5949 RepID=A0A078A4B6_STYLE|nr:UNKNOWN [Stylonychia lemnae]|eukprot:CDW77098.1 UNKNOWN [Stylonychia lemnae]